MNCKIIKLTNFFSKHFTILLSIICVNFISSLQFLVFRFRWNMKNGRHIENRNKRKTKKMSIFCYFIYELTFFYFIFTSKIVSYNFYYLNCYLNVMFVRGRPYHANTCFSWVGILDRELLKIISQKPRV
jgi:hypothetical protein